MIKSPLKANLARTRKCKIRLLSRDNFHYDDENGHDGYLLIVDPGSRVIWECVEHPFRIDFKATSPFDSGALNSTVQGPDGHQKNRAEAIVRSTVSYGDLFRYNVTLTDTGDFDDPDVQIDDGGNKAAIAALFLGGVGAGIALTLAMKR